MESKICKACGLSKPVDEYTFYNAGSGKRYPRPRCKRCVSVYNSQYLAANRERVRRKQRDYAQRTRHQARDRELKRAYGIGLAEFQEMLTAQDFKCLVCGRTAQEAKERHNVLHVDHDHSNGRVRGLLCSRCNRVLGMVQDDIEILEGMIEYVR